MPVITDFRIVDNFYLWEAFQGINNGRTKSQFRIVDNYYLYLVILGLIFPDLVSVTYAQLIALIGGNTLVPGQKYLLTDFQTREIIPNTLSVQIGVIEPLIIEATTTNTINASVVSTLFPADELLYEVVDSTTSGGDKGKIYYRRDTIRNNSTGYDWRNCKFRRWETAPGSGVFTVLTNTGGAFLDFYTFNNSASAANCTNNSIGQITAAGILNFGAPTDKLGNNVFLSTSAAAERIYNNIIGADSFNNTIAYGGNNKIFENIISVAFFGNTIETDFRQNIIGIEFTSNIIANGFAFNNVGTQFSSNQISIGFNSNNVGNGFNSNIVNFGVQHNTFGDDCNGNNYGNAFTQNTVGDRMLNCTFGSFCTLNSIGALCAFNTVGNNFSENQIAARMIVNIIGTDFTKNTIASSFSNNNLGNTFSENFIGDTFNANFIGDAFIGNDISSSMNSNTILDQFQFNAIKAGFSSNINIQNFFKFNNIEAQVTGFDFSLSVFVYGDYSKTIFRKDTSGGGSQYILSYINGADGAEVVNYALVNA